MARSLRAVLVALFFVIPLAGLASEWIRTEDLEVIRPLRLEKVVSRWSASDATTDGILIVEKMTRPQGVFDIFDFVGDASGSITDGQALVVSNVPPGNYYSTEQTPPSWVLATISCNDDDSFGNPATGRASLNVSSGETVHCVFENIRQDLVIFRDGFESGDTLTWSSHIGAP